MKKSVSEHIDISEILIKEIKGEISLAERHALERWIHKSESNKKLYLEIREGAGFDDALVLSTSFNASRSWKKVAANIDQKPSRNYFYAYAVAASMAILIGASLFFNKQPHAEIEAGQTVATLTTEQGEEITLKEGDNYQSEHAIIKGEALSYEQSERSNEVTLKYNYLTVPKGGEFQLTLSDGTQVWLNSDSRLKYPIQFPQGADRSVELVYGEAYFDVTPADSSGYRSFKVVSNEQEVEVLGTEFNVKNYTDDDYVFTSLVEGSVAVSTQKNKHISLTPDHQFILHKKEGTYRISEVDAKMESLWKMGVFSFDNTRMDEIMKVVARWYNITVVYENDDLRKQEFTGVFSKNQKIENILEILTKSIHSAYEIKNQTIILK